MNYFENRLRPDERLGVMHMDMLSRSFDVAIRDLGHKLDGYPNLEAEIEAMHTICLNMVAYALKDQDDGIKKVVLRQSRDFVIGLERRSPINKEQEVIMPISDEWQFVNIVLDSRCRTCLLTGAEAAQCQVRRLLRKYSDEPDPGFGHCGFVGCTVGQNSSMNEQKPI